MLSSASFGDTVVIADLEAGIGTLTRLEPASVDAVVVVVEPTPRSLDVGGRAVDLATERRQGRVVVVANRLTDDADLERVRAAFPHLPVVAVPDDPAVGAADRAGRSVMDDPVPSPAVEALGRLAGLLRPDRPA